MQLPRHHLLARPGLTLYEHRNVRGRDLPNERLHPRAPDAGGNTVVGVVVYRGFFVLPRPYTMLQRFPQALAIDGLTYNFIEARLVGFTGGAVYQTDRRDRRMLLPRFGHQFAYDTRFIRVCAHN